MRRDWRLPLAALLQVLALFLAYQWYKLGVQRAVDWTLANGADFQLIFASDREAYAFYGAVLSVFASIVLTIWAWLRSGRKSL